MNLVEILQYHKKNWKSDLPLWILIGTALGLGLFRFANADQSIEGINYIVSISDGIAVKDNI